MKKCIILIKINIFLQIIKISNLMYKVDIYIVNVQVLKKNKTSLILNLKYIFF